MECGEADTDAGEPAEHELNGAFEGPFEGVILGADPSQDTEAAGHSDDKSVANDAEQKSWKRKAGVRAILGSGVTGDRDFTQSTQHVDTKQNTDAEADQQARISK